MQNQVTDAEIARAPGSRIRTTPARFNIPAASNSKKHGLTTLGLMTNQPGTTTRAG